MDDVRVGCQISNQANPFALIYNFWHVCINSLFRIIPWTIECRITTVAFRNKTAERRYNHPEIPPPNPFLGCEQRGAIEPFPVWRCKMYIFVWISEQTAIISLYSINWLVCITETECVYCAVRTGSIYIIQVMCFVWISEQTLIISLYSINWLVFITETECVYCAVRTGSLYIIQVMCFVCIWEQTAIISLYIINWLVFITETECLLRGMDWVFKYISD